jgi:pimeloyl-ACP methyl ester carboxylesterase/DNA-binding CsgD family transcriptional regulator
VSEPAEPGIRRTRTADGVTIAWTVTGAPDGPVLVYLPGLPFSDFGAEWRIPLVRRALGRLGERVRLVQYDGRGSGRSQRDVEDLSLDAMLRDLDAVIDAAGSRTVVLLGFYHSVMLALAWTARHPERVDGLVLFGATARGWVPMSGAATQALISLIDQDWSTFVESAVHAWLGWLDPETGRLAVDWFRDATTPAIARATLRESSAIDVTGVLPSITCPVLVLHRAGATVLPIESSRELVASLPDARLDVLPGTSASLFLEDPERVADRIAAFVVDPDGSGGPIAGDSRTARVPEGTRIDAPATLLTAREREVLAALVRGLTNDEIAGALGISVNTVERHASSIYRKVDVPSRAGAVAWAFRNGLA